jgi:hypothetical protein
MPSKPLAYGLFVVACIASAGAGAYYALRQQAGPIAPAASLSAERASSTQPQPVLRQQTRPITPASSPPAERASATQPQPVVPAVTPTTIHSSSITATLAPPDAKTARAPAPAPRLQAPPASSATRRAAPKPQTEATVPAEKPLSDHQGLSTPQPRAAEATSQTPTSAPPPPSQGLDPGPSAQQPWPGPPVSQPQSQPPPQASGAVVEFVKAEQEAPVAERSRQWQEVVVPSESVIGLELESSINTEYARIEDQVDARVTRDVRVGGRVAIPAGTLAIGSVTMVERGGPVKTRARIGFRFHTLVFADRSRVSISTDAVFRVGASPGNQSSAKIGGAAIGGAIIGAILGGGKGAAIGSGIGAAGGAAAAMRGDRLPVVVPAGTTLSVRTQASFSLNLEK